MRMRTAALAVAVAALFAAPAPADFSNGQMQDFISTLSEMQDLDASQQTAVDKINATVEKTYASFSKELVAYAKVVKTAAKAFPEDEAVLAGIADLCDNESGHIDSIFFDLVFGSDGTNAAGVVLSQNVGVVKGALLYNKLVVKHFNKGNLQTDCSKKLKFFAKAAKGAEKIFKKYGPLDT